MTKTEDFIQKEWELKELLQVIFDAPGESLVIGEETKRKLDAVISKIKANIDKVSENKALLDSLPIKTDNLTDIKQAILDELEESCKAIENGKTVKEKIMGLIGISVLAEMVMGDEYKALAKKVVGDEYKALTKISEEPKLTKDAFFLSLTQAIDNPPVEIGRGKKRTKVETSALEALGLKKEDKVIVLSLFYGLVYYACKGYKEIKLTDLMEQTGFKKRVFGERTHGFSSEDKKKAVNILRCISIMEIRSEPFKEQVPYFVRRLFGDVAIKGDRIAITPFSIAFDLLEDKDGKIKDGIIKFTPNFNAQDVYFFDSNEPKILKIPNSERSYKLFSLFLARRKAFLSQNRVKETIIPVKELLSVCEIEIDRKNPKRVRDELIDILDKAKRDGIIKYYNEVLNGESYTRVRQHGYGWFDAWLGSEVAIGF
jgi:hypothetical protein